LARLVATLGTSPGVPYETLLNLCRGAYDAPYNPPLRIDSVTLVYTSSPRVVASYRAAQLLLACHRQLFKDNEKSLPEGCRLRDVGGVELGFEDVDTRERYESLSHRLYRVLGRDDVVDVSGGRAAMAAAASLAASRLGATVVATVVDPQLYSQTSSAFTALIQNYDLDKIHGEVLERGGCEVLEKYPGAAGLLRQLVTGRAKTFVLHP
jgi:hypothetical protein